MVTLVELGLVFRNIQAVWASAATAAPKKVGFRTASDYRVVNKQREKVPTVVANHETEMADMFGTSCLGKLDMLRGYWHMLLAAEAEEMFTNATPYGLVIPTRVPQSVLNSTRYFERV